MLLGALAFTTSACTNSDNEPNYGEIKLTTPVVQLADIQATASRGVAVTPTEEMKLNVELLKSDKSSTDRRAEYTYVTNAWNCTAPLIVTGGAGDYHARVLASGVNVGDVKSAFYSFNGTIGVANDGTFTIGKDDNNVQNDMQPLTAAIKVVLKDANGKAIADADIVDYTVKMTGVKKVTSVEWNNGDAKLNDTDCTDSDDAKSGVYAYYEPIILTAGTELLTVTYTNNSTNPATTTTWNVKTSSAGLTLDKGKLYTFNITLGGDTEITINPSNGITVGDFVNGEDIDIKR